MVLCRLSYEGKHGSKLPAAAFDFLNLVGRVGFEPTKAMPPILQTGPAHHLRRLPQ